MNSSLSSKLENMQAEYSSYKNQQETQLTLLREQLASETKRASGLEKEMTQTSVAASKCLSLSLWELFDHDCKF